MSDESTMYSDEQFNQDLAVALDWIGIMLQDKRKDITPTLIVHGIGTVEIADDDPVKKVLSVIGELREDGKVTTFVVMPDFDMAKRHDMLGNVGAQFARDAVPVLSIFFVTEAWVSTQQQGGSPLGARRYALPEQDPNRREIVQAAGMTYDGRSSLGSVQVSRDRKGNMVAGKRTIYAVGSDVELTNNICKAFFRGYVAAIASMN